MEAPMKLALLQNRIAQGEFSANVEVPIVLYDSQKTQFSNEWRTYRERNANLIKHRGQAFSLIQVQCTQILQDKMKQDTDWAVVSTSYDPLTRYRLIELTIFAQTEDQYQFSTMHDQELSFYSFKQETLSNPQCYERFNTKVDVSEANGVTRQHKVLLDYVAQESYTKSFDGLGVTEQKLVRDNAEERYVSYAFLQQSGIQHVNLKVDLQNDFTT
jgi:poly(A) polymerase Pap1